MPLTKGDTQTDFRRGHARFRPAREDRPQERGAGRRTLPPPGPLAPRRRRSRGPRTGLLRRTRGWIYSAVRAIAPRRRSIAAAALALTGAYVLVGLGAGSEPSVSDTGAPLGGADLPLDAGRADSSQVTGGAGSFEVTLPAGWEGTSTDSGDSLFSSPGGDAEVLVRVGEPTGAGLAERADAATALLAGELSPGAEVSRLSAELEGALLAVARSSGAGEQSTAYIGATEGAEYLLVSTYEEDASSLPRVQVDTVVRSFEPGPLP